MSGQAYQNIFFFSSLFIVFLINLFFWKSFKNKIHGFYSCYVILTLVLYAGFEGYLFDHGINEHVIDHLTFVILCGSMISLIFFTIFFLKIQELAPKFYRWTKKSVIGLVLVMTSYQFIFFNSSVRYLHGIENALSFVWIGLILVMLGISLKQKRPELKYYSVALFSYLLFLILGLIAPHIDFFNQFNIEFYTLFKIGVTLEVIIFTYTIVKVLSLNEKSQQKKNEELIETKENIAAENKSLKTKIENSNMQKMEFLAVLKLIESNLGNDEDWIDFKEKVNELNPSFLSSLKKEYPALTKNDLRLLLLIKIGFTQKEIAQMLFIAESSVKKSRQRVRKKLGLSAEITLPDFLANY